ncbi:hypothetical protein CY34DRAFT_811814 [Suillus luteus UH-Slu-Lm8-n1]|uniref:Ubiquitin-like domain-containing protein n=1 Tax=Suillus luteus UH-Slu-Lm8-n1 TaxID=930992 RepID=A0A0D0ACP4_9AGAM|nr:hypothetical protein CY34DRAFT_811814 [Suillus luteus UH-Slu-Lm8-n1]
MSVSNGNARNEQKQIPRRLVLKHGQKVVMVKRQRSYDLMLDSAFKHFPSIPRDVITLQSDKLDDCDGRYVDITAETWDDVIDLLTVAQVTRRAEMSSPAPLPLNTQAISLPDNQPEPSQVKRQDSSYAPPHSRADDTISIKIIYPSGDIKTTQVSRDMQVENFLAEACQISRSCPNSFRAALGTRPMHTKRSLRAYKIKDGDFIDLLPVMRLKKPVIYIYSPSDIDVSVKLSLTPEWTLSVIYPVVATKDNGQHIQWNVRTHRDGSLTEHNAGLDVAYLFWEAETNSHAFPHSPASEPLDTFSPISSSLSDTDSVVIPVDKVTAYLNKSLQVLGLHTEARTSFITYWLPSILKHKYIALRFVSQAAYERAASLSISPQPDVVARVFMLFKGIHKEHLEDWANAQMQAEKDVCGWVDVVGVDPARAGDATLFRVLEWGGMEVLV